MTIDAYGPRLPVHDHEASRHAMVDHQLRDVHDRRVVEAMRQVPRHLFVPEPHLGAAYAEVAIPVPYGRTLPPPRVVARMLEACELKGNERVLEAGVASGYETALLTLLGKEVYAMELVAGVARIAQHNLARADCTAHFIDGEPALGWAPAAPYDVILLLPASAGFTAVPEPLLEQLADRGRLVLPVGAEAIRALKRVRRHGRTFDVTEIALPVEPGSHS